jgi:acyl-CoA dehydrogenase
MDVFGRSDAGLELACATRRFVDQHAIDRENIAIAHDVPGLDEAAAQLRPLAHEAGVFGPMLPAEFGGHALNWRDAQLVLEAAGRSPLGPIALNCGPPDGPNASTLARLATEEQKDRFLAPLMRGEMRSCFAMTEPSPGAGSDPRMLSTTARRTADGDFELNGHKWFISGAEGATIAIVMAVTDEGPSFFLVETDNPGWRHVRTIPSLDGYQIGGHGEIVLDACRIPADALLGRAGQGLVYAQNRLEPARLAHCMRLTGRAERAIEIAERYVSERQSFGKRVADHQLAQGLVADARISLEAARLMTWQVAARLDAGESVVQTSAMAKVFVSEALGRVVDTAMQLCGATGLSHDTPIAGFYQELRAFRVYDGASEVHRGAIGRRCLKQVNLDAR